MIRTIKWRIYVVGLLPLALLAAALVLFNGLSRIQEAKEAMASASRTTSVLLQSAAVEALVLGGISQFEIAVRDVRNATPAVLCVQLRDTKKQVVARGGNCGELIGIFEPVVATADGLADFAELTESSAIVGSLAIVMSQESVERKRRQVVFQLLMSLAMVALVLFFVGRVLRARLIQPIERIGAAMDALGRRDYSVRAVVEGRDELRRLATAVNSAVVTIETYTRELERRRTEADRALHDADAANLMREGVVQSLAEDFEEPMNQIQLELIEIARTNMDPHIGKRVKIALALLQQAQEELTDLMEIVVGSEGVGASPARSVVDVLRDIKTGLQRISDLERVPARLSRSNVSNDFEYALEEIYLDIDAVRLAKALLLTTKAMARQVDPAGIQVIVDFLRISSERLHLSIRAIGLYEREAVTIPIAWGGSPQQSNLRIVGLTDREQKVVEYLLRAVGVSTGVTVSNGGVVSVLLDVTSRYSREPFQDGLVDSWLATETVSITLVSNDLNLLRLTTRGAIANMDVKLVAFDRALLTISALRHERVVVIDVADDTADAMKVLQAVTSGEESPSLIAVCPPGPISEALTEDLLRLGFRSFLQKPLHYGRLVAAIRSALDGSAHFSRPSTP